ncbi:MAG TPA: hypothetical protein VMV43_12520 [Candidatus Nanopelagicaceae bacterium]|nr:hypothetical protein [Candidatus Nanopelagicaceae bacterium]
MRSNEDKIKFYDKLKDYNSQIYTGMKIGGSHKWHYNNSTWFETKVAPSQWTFNFQSTKTRFHSAPINSGAKLNTKYHWYIIADQIASKLNANSYITNMKGIKFKIGHKRPNWKMFSYQYPEQESYKEHVIKILESTLVRLRNERMGLEKFVL